MGSHTPSGTGLVDLALESQGMSNAPTSVATGYMADMVRGLRLSKSRIGTDKEPTIMVECTEADVRTLLNDTLTKLRDMAVGMLQGTKPKRDDSFDRMARYLEEARTLTHRLREFRPKKPETGDE